METIFQIISLKLNELNNPVKHKQVMTKLYEDEAQIINLQGTCLSKGKRDAQRVWI